MLLQFAYILSRKMTISNWIKNSSNQAITLNAKIRLYFLPKLKKVDKFDFFGFSKY